MNLNPAEKKVLRFLVEEGSEDFGCFSFDAIKRHVRLPRDVIRRACRSLKRKGLTEFHIGLWTDDGEPAGSGYGASKAGRGFIDDQHIAIRKALRSPVMTA